MIFTILGAIVRIGQILIIGAIGYYLVSSEPVTAEELVSKWKELQE